MSSLNIRGSCVDKTDRLPTHCWLQLPQQPTHQHSLSSASRVGRFSVGRDTSTPSQVLSFAPVLPQTQNSSLLQLQPPFMSQRKHIGAGTPASTSLVLKKWREGTPSSVASSSLSRKKRSGGTPLSVVSTSLSRKKRKRGPPSSAEEDDEDYSIKKDDKDVFCACYQSGSQQYHGGEGWWENGLNHCQSSQCVYGESLSPWRGASILVTTE